MFIKLKHIHITKLAKFSIDKGYEGLTEIARLKFPELNEKPVFFADRDGTILEEDVISDFLKIYSESNEILLLIICRIRDETSTNETLSNASTSTYSIISGDNSNISLSDSDNATEILHTIAVEDRGLAQETEPAEIYELPKFEERPENSKTISYKELLTVEEWKQFIVSRMGNEIFDQYESYGYLQKSLRVNLVNVTIAELVRRYGISVPEFAKRNLAQAIITIFPKLRNPLGSTGYEAFYNNDNGGEGFISYRLRFIARTSKDENVKKMIHRRKRKTETKTETCSQSPKKIRKERDGHNELEITTEIKEYVEFLRNACPMNDREAIPDRMTKTFAYRQSLSEDFLKFFPRFLDTPYLVEHDFYLQFPNKHITFPEDITRDAVKLLDIYRTEISRISPEVIIGIDEDSSDKYDLTTRYYWLWLPCYKLV